MLTPGTQVQILLIKIGDEHPFTHAVSGITAAYKFLANYCLQHWCNPRGQLRISREEAATLPPRDSIRIYYEDAELEDAYRIYPVLIDADGINEPIPFLEGKDLNQLRREGFCLPVT